MSIELHHQFLFSSSPLSSPPQDWARHVHSQGELYAHPSLPVLELKDSAGEPCGFALGHLIDLAGNYVSQSLILPNSAQEPSAVGSVEDFVYGFGGRFLFIVLHPALNRVYLDPLGSLAAVWCSQRKRIASTCSALLFDEPDHPLHSPDLTAFPHHQPNLYYPPPLTPVAEIRRIIPNHYLSLSSWTQHRHHPLSLDVDESAEAVETIAETFYETTRRQIRAFVEQCGGGYVALTGGYDSRRLLACARPVTDRIECVTLGRSGHADNKKAALDVELAQRVSRIAGLKHHLLEMDHPDPGNALNYLRRIGYSGNAGKAFKFYTPLIESLDLDRVWMVGHGFHFDRVLCKPRSSTENQSSLEDLYRAVHLGRLWRGPQRPDLNEAMENWLATVPSGPAFQQQALGVLELRIGSWAAPHLYGTAPFQMIVLPSNHRATVDALLRLPLSIRRQPGGMTSAVLDRAWPELSRIPINQPGLLPRPLRVMRGWLERLGRG